jgi:hypothetical protein
MVDKRFERVGGFALWTLETFIVRKLVDSTVPPASQRLYCSGYRTSAMYSRSKVGLGSMHDLHARQLHDGHCVVEESCYYDRLPRSR